ncbi:hypothetical protein, partial [Candidatus Magnetominusculus dajiuhuensis]|uniref:hypothetical protein n=1 Tax=Candidatus Magnetominusculus dajiuhuensis TaxID=3137712 RepID=UPI003B439455
SKKKGGGGCFTIVTQSVRGNDRIKNMKTTDKAEQMNTKNIMPFSFFVIPAEAGIQETIGQR